MTPGGMPPAERLWLAASRCDVDAVHRLVGAGAPVGRDLGGGRRTALHAAAQTWTKARGDCIATAAALIRAGADLRLSVDGQTPIDLALAQDRLLVAAYKGALVRRPLLGAFLVSALSRGHAL
jgi:ankyrin repeat protein